MSLIYEHDNQMIVRFPKDVAVKIRDMLNRGLNSQMKIQPFTETSQVQIPLNDQESTMVQKTTTQMKFEVSIPHINYNAIGSLIDLPTITESYKSKDYINLYKSNDINQMIWFEGKAPQDKIEKGVRKIYEAPTQKGQNYQTKLVSDSGLTPATFEVRKDCHRKLPYIPESQIQNIEKELEDIQKQFMQQGQGQDQDDSGFDGESRSMMEKERKRQRKRYNKF